ncbi:hypothetical protein ACQ4PT_027446 [Festuca glaucescens]
MAVVALRVRWRCSAADGSSKMTAMSSNSPRDPMAGGELHADGDDGNGGVAAEEGTMLMIHLGSSCSWSSPSPSPTNSRTTTAPCCIGDIPVSLLRYGRFTAAQKAIVSDFLVSLSAVPRASPAPSVSQWWSSIHQLYLSKAAAVGTSGRHGSGAAKIARVVLSGQVSDEGCSLGKSLKLSQLPALAARARPAKGGIALVLTAQDVAVEGFCMSRCGRHGSVDAKAGTAYVWAGNSVAQCPGKCAWPFHQPAYGPQSPPLAPPNGDVGMDGLVINVASMVAGAVTNPFGDGFYQGDRAAPLEAATACPGVYGKGAYPGCAGQLRRPAAGGLCHRGELQRQRRPRPEVPAPGAVRPRHVRLLHASVRVLPVRWCCAVAVTGDLTAMLLLVVL